MTNVERAKVSEAFMKEAEGGIGEREKAKIALQVLEAQFAVKENLGEGKAAEVWTGDLPIFEQKVCVKTNYNPHASVNTLSHEFDLHEKFLKSGARVPKPWMYVEGDSDASTPVQNGSLVMEAIDGQTLEQMILELEAKGKKLTPERVQEMVNDIKEQIRLAHKQSLYHRDLHFRNVIIGKEDGLAYILDFGDATESHGVSSEDDIYKSEVSENGKIVTRVFPKDEDVIKTLKNELTKRDLVQKHD